MIKLNIDVTKIDKKKLYKGEKGTYLNAIMIETPNSEYSDYMIVEETSKEEKESGVKGVILGNAKVLKKQDVKKNDNNEDNFNDVDDLPF